MKNYILAILLGLIMSSCGARKAEKERAEESAKNEIADNSKYKKSEETEAKSEVNIKKSEELIINDQDQTTTVKEVLEPVDNTKPASYKDKDGKLQELNNAKKTTETTTKNNNTKIKGSTKTESSEKVDEKAKKKESVKNDIKAKSDTKKVSKNISVNRDAWNLLWLLIFIPVWWVCKNWTRITEKFWWV